MLISLLVPVLAGVPGALGLQRSDGVGRLPALGWNSWNAYHCDINEAKFLSAAQKVVSLGLKDAGYEYVNIDDCWSVKLDAAKGQTGRDAKTGRILPDTAKFPDGIAGLATKVHALDLKIGIYSDAGSATCAGYPASLGHEMVDAQTFSDWGIDYLKYDNCNVPIEWKDPCDFCQEFNATGGHCKGNNYCPPSFDWSKSKSAERFNRMRDALLAQKRPMLYSLCQWGSANIQSWGNGTAQSWRATGDIEDRWDSVLDLLNRNSFTMNHVNFWGHSDADMLEIGNGGLTPAEERTHFAFWAAMKSPLLIGTDLAKIKPSSLAILKNKYLLAFNQDDTIGEPAMPFRWGTNPDWTFNATHPAEFWSGRFKQGTLVLVLNVSKVQVSTRFTWAEVPQLKGAERYRVSDAWTGRTYGCFDAGFDAVIHAHDTAVLVITTDC